LPLYQFGTKYGIIARQLMVPQPYFSVRAAPFAASAMVSHCAAASRKDTATAPHTPAAARQRLHAIIYDELVQGRVEEGSRRAFIDIVQTAKRDDGVDGAILGCTEFGLLVTADDLPTAAFDTAGLHARAAMDFALAA